jgi:outer membrane lipoprotein carrier protein
MKKLLLVAIALSSPPATAQTATTVLATAEATYRDIKTLHAEFTQMLVNPMMGDETTTGTLYLSPPGRFSMRFSQPEGDRIVADGEWLWLYTPSTTPNQVIRQSIPEMGPATPNLFGQFVDNSLARYHATYVGVDSAAGYRVENVRLVPRVDGIPFRSVVISLSADGMLRKVNIVEDSGQRRTLVFDSIVVNAPISENELIFHVPRGTRIVTNLES